MHDINASEAMEHYKKAVRAKPDPSVPNVFINIGTLERDWQNVPAAIEAYAAPSLRCSTSMHAS